MKYESFNQGDTIIREGEEGDWLFLIFSGSAIASKNIDGVE